MNIKDLFDSYSDDDDAEEPKFNKECKYCGKGGLAWFDFNGKHRLINHRSEVHKCKPKPIDVDKLMNTKL